MNFLKGFLVGSVSLLIVACGSGGDGFNVNSGISYNGVTTPATITGDNAEDIATGAYQNGNSPEGMDFGGFALVQDSQGAPITHSRNLVLSEALVKVISQIDFSSVSNDVAISAVETENYSEPGNCGGNMSVNSRVDDVSGEVNGTIIFNDYCEDGTTLSGSINISGTIDGGPGEPSEFTISFTTLTVVSDGDSFTVNGSISFNFDDFYIMTLTINMYVRDNIEGKVYWVSNYELSITTVSSGYYSYLYDVDIEVSGDFYDPDYGLAVLSTSEHLHIYSGDENPSSGVLIVTGATGIAGGSTKARLTALSSTTYKVEADTNGDGAYNWDSGIQYWSEL